MKKLKNTAYGLMALLLTLAVLAVAKPALAATPANVTYSLSPATATITNGQNLTLGVYEDSGTDQVNAVQVNMSFPASGLNLTGVDYTGSAFDSGSQGSETSAGPGTITISRFFPVRCNGGTLQLDGTCDTGTLQNGVSGRQLIATLYFTVTATSGTLNVTFNSGSTAASPPSGTKANITSQNGTYSFASTATPPPVTPPTSGGSGGSSSSTTKKTTTSSPKPASTTTNTVYSSSSGKLTISQIVVSSLSGNTATISWTSSAPATSEVDYGLSADRLFTTASDATPSTSHSLKLDPSNLAAGRTYYFLVKSADSAGNIVSSQVLSFKTNTASKPVPAKSSNNTKVAVAVVTIIGLAAIGGAVAIRQMHRRAQQNQEVNTHVFSSLNTPNTPVSETKVITPQSKAADSKPPDSPKAG